MNFYFIMNQETRELNTRLIYEDRCDERLKARVKMRNLHVSHTLGCAIPLSYILGDVSFEEVGRVYRVTLREPIHLCTFVSEEGGEGEAARSETQSLCE